MPAIGLVGSLVTVTPSDEIQIIYSPGNHEFIDDRSPFTLKVDGTYMQNGVIIGVHGNVISGPNRYLGRVATLLVRTDGADWSRDNRSAANFKVSSVPARLHDREPYYHPEGSDVDYPFIIRYGSLDSSAKGEPPINSSTKI